MRRRDPIRREGWMESGEMHDCRAHCTELRLLTVAEAIAAEARAPACAPPPPPLVLSEAVIGRSRH